MITCAPEVKITSGALFFSAMDQFACSEVHMICVLFWRMISECIRKSPRDAKKILNKKTPPHFYPTKQYYTTFHDCGRMYFK